MRFSFGKLVWTRGINDRVATDSIFAKFVMESLKRHINCDWGELSAEDKRENDVSLDKELRLFSTTTVAVFTEKIVQRFDSIFSSDQFIEYI
jgi:hypothetical protein